jgi:high-affinity iron transporter
MIGALVITLREGLEAALIVGILLSYLTRVGRADRGLSVWIGTGLAVLAAVGAGAALFLTGGEIEGASEQLFEGTALLLAVGMLSYMIHWMRGQASGLRASLQKRVEVALEASGWSLASVAFLVVVREGLETALFLFGAAQASSAGATLSGGLLGLAVAIGIGYGVYRGGLRLDLRAFFAVTGLLLIFFAGGMLAHGVHELVEAGALPGIVDPVWDSNSTIPESSTLGLFLKALLGYSGSPTLLEVLAYAGYLAVMLRHYLPQWAQRATIGRAA